jgi:hypothetical protein
MIEQRCTCGRALLLRDELAGKLIRCPQCAAVLEVLDRVEVVEEPEPTREAPRKGPPPLPAMPPAGADDEEFVEVVAVNDPPQTAPPPVEKEEAYLAAPPAPVKKRPSLPKQRRKKQSVFTEMYGDEPSDFGLYRESRFLQNLIIGGIIALLVVGLGVALWSQAGMYVVILVVVFLVGAIGVFLGVQGDWWYW